LKAQQKTKKEEQDLFEKLKDELDKAEVEEALERSASIN